MLEMIFMFSLRTKAYIYDSLDRPDMKLYVEELSVTVVGPGCVRHVLHCRIYSWIDVR